MHSNDLELPEQEIGYLTFLILEKRCKNEISVNDKKYAIDSVVIYPTKSIKWPMVYVETTGKLEI